MTIRRNHLGDKKRWHQSLDPGGICFTFMIV